MRFEDFLTKVMSILGLSQRGLGKVIDMSNQSVSFYVNGKQDVPSTTKVAIVYHLVLWRSYGGVKRYEIN